MKILGSQLANAALLMDLDGVRPPQGISPQQIVDLIGPRYNFAGKPKLGGVPRFMGLPGPFSLAGPLPVGVQLQLPLIFQNGTAAIGDKRITIPRLDCAPDISMLVVHSLTSDEGDDVLNDLVSLLEGANGFHDIASNSLRRYTSSVVVEFGKSIEDSIKIIGEIQDIINIPFKNAVGFTEDAKIERLSFSFDSTKVPASKVQFINSFTIERRANHPYSDNRYFSSAPMRTSDHLRVLSQIGELLEGRSSSDT